MTAIPPQNLLQGFHFGNRTQAIVSNLVEQLTHLRGQQQTDAMKERLETLGLPLLQPPQSFAREDSEETTTAQIVPATSADSNGYYLEVVTAPMGFGAGAFVSATTVGTTRLVLAKATRSFVGAIGGGRIFIARDVRAQWAFWNSLSGHWRANSEASFLFQPVNPSHQRPFFHNHHNNYDGTNRKFQPIRGQTTSSTAGDSSTFYLDHVRPNYYDDTQRGNDAGADYGDHRHSEVIRWQQ